MVTIDVTKNADLLKQLFYNLRFQKNSFATGHEGTDSNDAWLVRCSANGDVHWQHTYGLRTGHEWLNAVVRGTDGAVLAAGWTTSSGVGRHDLLFAFVAPDALP